MAAFRETIDRRRAEILALAARCGAHSVRILGSVARRGESEHSDVDFLVVLGPGRSLLDHAGLKLGLEELLGRPVHVATERGLKPKFRERILDEAVAL
ncbi:MAG: nucleotidyltransferase domain-containing protein [Fimbriimonadaceae bacterium]|nr:nucleotidyltransferase domain-containing protein [Fimbriimonadaceae bacterium]